MLPKAAIDPDHASLIDWPKAQSLLPPLRTAKGDVPFGEAYLAWSDRGIALATIGQDYYDTEVLAYDGAFPLSEAYRIELDIDAGAGPKRFTLYFIPPKGKTRDYPPMAPMLCAGAPAEHHGRSCPPVPGAATLYFGADQPRIVAETMIPWQAFGLAGPPDASASSSRFQRAAGSARAGCRCRVKRPKRLGRSRRLDRSHPRRRNGGDAVGARTRTLSGADRRGPFALRTGR